MKKFFFLTALLVGFGAHVNAQVIAGSNAHSIFRCGSGQVRACGDNHYGSLGDGTLTDRLLPVQVSGLSGITAVSAADEYSLFLKNDSTVWGCGKATYGQLGDGTATVSYLPAQGSYLSGITAVAVD